MLQQKQIYMKTVQCMYIYIYNVWYNYLSSKGKVCGQCMFHGERRTVFHISLLHCTIPSVTEDK